MIEEFLKQFGIRKKVNAIKLGNAFFRDIDEQLVKKRPVYSGECVGHQRGNLFVPSIGFLQEIAKDAKDKAAVDAKGEWLFICGRDVKEKHILSGAEGLVVVLNERKECIGYGKREKAGIVRLFDIGDLLRRERKRRKVKAF